MHNFVVVVVKPGRHLPREVAELLDAPAPPELMFVPDDRLRWSDGTGTTHFAGWTVGDEVFGAGPPWEVRPRGLTAYAGHPWVPGRSWSTGATWASQLADHLEREPLASAGTHLDGVHAVVSLGADGHGSVVADPLGMTVVYEAETDDLVVVSNRASLAARATARDGCRPARDPEGVGWVLYLGSQVGDRTGYEAVRALPQDTRVVLAPGQVPRHHTRSPMPWLDGSSVAGDTEAAERVAEAGAHLRSLVRIHAELPGAARRFELTGGHDSRLMLALVLAEGLEEAFEFVTWGSATLPDTIVAGDIAARFGLRHDLPYQRTGRDELPPGTERRVRLPFPPPGTHLHRLRQQVAVTSAEVSAWSQRGGAGPAWTGVSMTGLTGELLRTNYHRTDGVQTMDDLRAFVAAGRFVQDPARLLLPEVRRHYDRLFVDQLEEALPPGGTAQDAVDGWYARHRIRRWGGSTMALDRWNRVCPLYSIEAIRAAFAIGSVRRRDEFLPFELMRGACDELATMPFAGSAWPARAVAHVPDGDRYPTAPPVQPWRPPQAPEVAPEPGPRPPRPLATVGQEAGVRRIQDKTSAFRSLFDLGADHPAFDILDRRAIELAVEDLGDASTMHRRGVHDAATVAIWLSSSEQPASP